MATETGEFHTAQYPIAYAPISNPESSAGEEKENRDFSGGDRKLWTPFFLRRSVLGGFLALFVAILASLVALFVYTERQGKSLGIETPGERFYYLWTYGPTAIFMILTAGWTQVEYRSMQMMPWVLMFKGPTPAAESVFLDYMSLLNVVSLYRSLRQKHFLVFLCVAGSLLLNGLSVISTGLFELDNRQIPRAADFTVTHQFDASNWNPLASDALPFVACLGYTGQNLTPPIGVHDSYIYSPFQPVDPLMSDSSKLEANNEYEVDLDIFDMDLHCEPTRRTVNTTARTEDQMDGGTIKGEDIFDSEDGCRMTTIPDVFDSTEAPDVSYEFDWRLWAMISPRMLKDDEDMHDTAWQDIDVTTIACKMYYHMSHGKVTIWREPGSNTISSSIKSKELPPSKSLTNVTGNKLLFAVDQALTVGSTNFRLASGEQSVFASEKSLDELRKSPTAFTQAIKDSYPYRVRGIKRAAEPRLFVRPLSFWLMAALMGTLIFAVILLLLFQLPVSVCPRDTSSIAGLSTVFAQSPELMAIFKGTALKPIESMEKSHLQTTQFSIQMEHDGAYRLVPGSEEPIQDKPIKPKVSTEDEQIFWWRPLSSTLYIQLPAVIAPLGVIAALEVVYHISQSSHGITLVEGKSDYIHYIWTYIPALIMFTVRCLFQSVEFGARILQPYVELRKGSAPPETSIFENQLRKIAAFGVVDALRKRQWALAGATLTLLLAAATPIVVAGLYTNLSYPQWTYRDLAFPQVLLNGTQNATQDRNPNATSQHGFVTARLPAVRPRLSCLEDKSLNCTKDSTDEYDCSADSCFSQDDYFRGNFMLGYGGGGGHGVDLPSTSCPTYYILYGGDDPRHHLIACNASIETVDVDVRFEVPSFSLDPDFEPRVVHGSAKETFRTSISTWPEFDRFKNYLAKAPLAMGDLPDQSLSSFVMEAMVNGTGGVPFEELWNPATFISRFSDIWSISVTQIINTAARQSFEGVPNPTDSVWPNTTHAPVHQAIYHDGRSNGHMRSDFYDMHADETDVAKEP
ncbi:hypothetical protein N7471_007673 [Penicillium samsonianum]|uniref:uncharacterized protein n=1 Tax=Penicillium samsonianum TaxID=1882272 RepID=UPI0025470281|nr:uncharacterized protein N7471_007673 [Penicillium samsonianum]KAJ6132458.1 hypothetical protein N7471_007673 [Penicillium samsonianum]